MLIMLAGAHHARSLVLIMPKSRPFGLQNGCYGFATTLWLESRPVSGFWGRPGTILGAGSRFQAPGLGSNLGAGSRIGPMQIHVHLTDTPKHRRQAQNWTCANANHNMQHLRSGTCAHKPSACRHASQRRPGSARARLNCVPIKQCHMLLQAWSPQFCVIRLASSVSSSGAGKSLCLCLYWMSLASTVLQGSACMLRLHVGN